MAEPKRVNGVVLLPEGAQDEFSPCSGIVIAVGENDFGVNVGDTVVLDPYAGTYYGNTWGYEFVCFVGIEDSNSSYEPCSMDDHILCVLEEWMRVRPIGKRVFVAFEGFKEKTDSGLYVPGRAQRSSNVATVLEVGSQVEGVKPGDKVLLRYGTVTRLELDDSIREAYGVEGKRLGFVLEEGIYGVI